MTYLIRFWPVGIAALGLWLYWGTLQAFFIFDDLSILRIACVESTSFWGCLKPMSNGFWRPGILLLARGLVGVFGYSPLAFHSVALGLVVVNACLAGFYFRVLFGGGQVGPMLVAVLCMLHIGSWDVGSQYLNACDSMLTFFVLVGLIFWERVLMSKPRNLKCLDVAVVFGCFLGAIMSKETGVIYGFLLAGRWLFSCATFRWRGLMTCLVLLSLAYAGISYKVLTSTAHSYINSGRVSIDLGNAFYQWLDFIVFLICPYLEWFEPPFNSLVDRESILKLLVILPFISIIVVMTSGILPSPKWLWKHRVSLFLVLAIFLMLALPSLQNVIHGRFVYPAIPFYSILIVRVLSLVNKPLRVLGDGVLAGLYVWFALGFFYSPRVIGYKNITRDVEAFMGEVRRESVEWPAGGTVTILNHPHPGNEPGRWVYVQHLMVIFLPEKPVTVMLVEVPGVFGVYEFVGGKLERR